MKEDIEIIATVLKGDIPMFYVSSAWEEIYHIPFTRYYIRHSKYYIDFEYPGIFKWGDMVTFYDKSIFHDRIVKIWYPFGNKVWSIVKTLTLEEL